MIKILLLAMIAGFTIKPGTVDEVNKTIVSIDDGADIWDVYGDGYIPGDKVNMVFWNDSVIALF